MDTNLIESLKRAVSIFKATRAQKLKKVPVRLIYSKILELISRWLDKPFKVKAKTFWGEEMFLIIPEVVSLRIYRYGFHEENLTKMILEYLKPGMTFFDIGAHIGYFTMLASYIVGEKSMVHSFEPTPNTYEVLIQNIKRKNVITNNCAVFSKETFIRFNDYGSKYSAFNTFKKARLDESILKNLNPISVKVKTVTLDKYVKMEKCKPDFIKIDVENAELEVLQGAKDTIKEFHPIISIEVGDFDLNDKHSSECISLLNNYGYQAYEYRNNRILKHNIKNKYVYDNILFLYQK
ncbi:MAG: FkbM family methyltransferase [Actinomycetia bacterium]|nr:FkbM family methyltransferase [Actinomycetes bacterium]